MNVSWGTVGATTLGLLFASGAYPQEARQIVGVAAWVMSTVRYTMGKYGTWFDYLVVYLVLLIVGMVILGIFASLRQASKKVL
jgi:hypothetical protein